MVLLKVANITANIIFFICTSLLLQTNVVINVGLNYLCLFAIWLVCEVLTFPYKHEDLGNDMLVSSSVRELRSSERCMSNTLEHTYTHTHTQHLASPRHCHFSIKVCKAEGMLRQQGLALHRARLSEERCVLPSATNNKTW